MDKRLRLPQLSHVATTIIIITSHHITYWWHVPTAAVTADDSGAVLHKSLTVDPLR